MIERRHESRQQGIEDLKEQAKELWQARERSRKVSTEQARAAVKHSLQLGRVLAKIKKKIPHGFRTWCSREGIDFRRAYECMWFARHSDLVKKAKSLTEARRIRRENSDPQKASDVGCFEAGEPQSEKPAKTPSASKPRRKKETGGVPKGHRTTSLAMEIDEIVALGRKSGPPETDESWLAWLDALQQLSRKYEARERGWDEAD